MGLFIKLTWLTITPCNFFHSITFFNGKYGQFLSHLNGSGGPGGSMS